MQAPIIPPDEFERLAALDRYEVLDTAAEPAFDAITAMVAKILGTPIALVSLVDADRQWFKSRYGLDAAETPREVSFCGHVVASGAPLVVPDATQDVRFADNPLVTGGPRVTFYAGFPLVTPEGHTLGSLCAIDQQPRELTADQQEFLGLLAKQVVVLLELRHAHRRLEAKQASLATQRTFFALALDLLCTVDATLQFKDLNPAWVTTLGWGLDELRSRALTTFVHPEDVDATLQEADRLLTTEGARAVNFEHRFQHKDGHWVPLVWTVAVKDGMFFAAARDVSALRASEADTRAREHQLKQLFDTMVEGVVVHDAAGAITDANAAASRILQLDRDQLLGKSPLDPHWQAIDTQGMPLPGEAHPAMVALRTGEPQNDFPMGVRLPDGSMIGVWANARVLVDREDGRTTGAVVTFRDVTEHLRQQEALAAAEARHRGIVEAAMDAILTLDPAGLIVGANPAAARLFGYQPEDMLGTGIGVLLPVVGCTTDGQGAGHGILTGREVLARRADGSEFPVEPSVGEFAVGEHTTTILVLRDISERRQIERMQAEFISTVSHELRTPLTAIRGALGLVHGGMMGELPAEAREYVGIAVNNCDRLVRLINDILDIEKMQSGRMEFRMQPLALADQLQAAIAANHGVAKGQGVDLVLLGDVPGGEVLVDGDRLQQVLTNLISNAIKFSPCGGRVEVSAHLDGEHVHVGVRDHGPGIPAAFRDRVFERFAQADSSDTRPKGGTGLGLNIVNAIVTRMRGRVGFLDGDGGGTEFYFKLPHFPPAEAVGEAGPGSRPLALVCEDDADVAMVLARTLAIAGFEARIAATVAQARAVIEREHLALITLDLGLADGDATDLVRLVRQREGGANIPILVITGVARDEATRRLNGNVTAVVDIIEKPFDPARLHEALVAAQQLGRKGAPLVLHVEDDVDIARVLRRHMPAAWIVDLAPSVAEARRLLSSKRYDFVILDLGLPDGRGEQLIEHVGDAKVIIFSADQVPNLAERVEAVLLKSGVGNTALVEAIKARLPSEGLAASAATGTQVDRSEGGAA